MGLHSDHEAYFHEDARVFRSACLHHDSENGKEQRLLIQWPSNLTCHIIPYTKYQRFYKNWVYIASEVHDII